MTTFTGYSETPREELNRVMNWFKEQGFFAKRHYGVYDGKFPESAPEFSQAYTFDAPYKSSINPSERSIELAVKWSLFNFSSGSSLAPLGLRNEFSFSLISRPMFMAVPNKVIYSSNEIVDLYQKIIDKAENILCKEGLYSQENVVKLVMQTSSNEYITVKNGDGRFSVDVKDWETRRSRCKDDLALQLDYIRNGFTFQDIAFLEFYKVSVEDYRDALGIPLEWRTKMLATPLISTLKL